MSPPDDALFEAVLAKHFSDRGIRPGEGVLRWLVQRLERSYLAAAEAVERLDASALAEGRELRLPLLHQVFKDSPLSSRTALSFSPLLRRSPKRLGPGLRPLGGFSPL